MTYDEWIALGITNGWTGPAVCYTHDGLPTTQAEDEEFEMGDPCIHILRLYDDAEVKQAVQENHSPSVWRATNNGIDV
jgi:hypothetical protein